MNSGRYGFTNQAFLKLKRLPEDLAQLVRDIAQALPVWVARQQIVPHGYDEFEKPFYKAKYEKNDRVIVLEFHLQISRMSPRRAIIRDIDISD